MTTSEATEAAPVSLAEYVGAPSKNSAICAQCETVAATRLQIYIGAAAWPEIPKEIRQQAILEVGANLYQRKLARSDVGNFADGSLTAPAPLPALDPLTPVYPLLRPYLRPGIA